MCIPKEGTTELGKRGEQTTHGESKTIRMWMGLFVEIPYERRPTMVAIGQQTTCEE